MTEQDQANMRQMLTDVLKGHANEVEGKFEVINVHLVAIKEQTTKTNGRVTKLEDFKAKHILECPYVQRIETLEKSDLSRKSVIKFIATTIVLSASIGGLIVALSQLVIK